MSLLRKIILILWSIPIFSSLASPGDTIVVQTIDYYTPVLPWWNAPRDGTYLFPPDSINFSKILMYYTLKCDPSQNPACGEWDYTTNTQLMFHTGEYDSTLYFHPNFIVDGATPDSFLYMEDTSWTFYPRIEYSNQTIPALTASLGQSSLNGNIFSEGSDDGRMVFLYLAEELTAAGLYQGQLTGMHWNLTSASGYFNNFSIRIKATDSAFLTPENFVDAGFESVYSKNTSFTASGWQNISFSHPYLWDGTSNILIEISYAGHDGPVTAQYKGDEQSYSAGIRDPGKDFYLDFEGWDHVSIPPTSLETIDSAITISFWQYGDPAKQPQNNTILEGVDSAGHRLLNVHLPWSDSRVYWDAGYSDGGYDRIYRMAPPEDFEGQWNYWTFTKDCRTGAMSVYLNGELWIFAWGKYRSMSGITDFKVGSAIDGSINYDGMVDELQIWNTVLDQDIIREWMNKDLASSHPNYNNLIVYYKFNEGSGFTTTEETSGVEATLFGYPHWLQYSGKDRHRAFTNIAVRPAIKLELGYYDPLSLDSALVVDTLDKAPISIVMYEDELNPVQPTDTLTKWPSYYNDYVYDPNGQAVDSNLVDPDGILYRQDNGYYGEPFEIIIPYELGRYITPYGNNLSLGDGWTWIYDVTDFRPMLADSVHLRAGNFQELLDLKFYMIEGMPPRDVVKINRLWDGYYSLSAFNEQVPPAIIHLDEATETTKLKITTSGHEWDNATNCAEFCQKTHWVDINDITAHTWQILDECGDNPLYPQGGTWIYDRAGWCPGKKVTEQHIETTSFIAGDSAVIDYNCESDIYGGYSVTGFLFEYSGFNFDLDATVEEVIAPNEMDIYGRFNPMCGIPVIRIKNSGGDTIVSLDIEYYVEGGVIQSFQWIGTLSPMESTLVNLNPIDWSQWNPGSQVFHVTVKNPNGEQDENPLNDGFSTKLNLAPEYPNQFIIQFKTNKLAAENRYVIKDSSGNTILTRDNFENETIYYDTVLLEDGCYEFTLYDEGNDGISFWAHGFQGSGYIKFVNLNGSNLHYFQGDFGAYALHNFTVGLAVETNDLVKDDYVNIYPNPTADVLNIAFALKSSNDVSIEIIDLSGRILQSENLKMISKNVHSLNLKDLTNGLYFCRIKINDQYFTRKVILKH